MGGPPEFEDSRHNNRTLEIFDPATGRWTDQGAGADIPASDTSDLPQYPRLHVLPDGRVFCATPIEGPPGGPGWHELDVESRHARRGRASGPGPGGEYVGFDTSSVLLPLKRADNYRARVLYTNRPDPKIIDLSRRGPDLADDVAAGALRSGDGASPALPRDVGHPGRRHRARHRRPQRSEQLGPAGADRREVRPVDRHLVDSGDGRRAARLPLGGAPPAGRPRVDGRLRLRQRRPRAAHGDLLAPLPLRRLSPDDHRRPGRPHGGRGLRRSSLPTPPTSRRSPSCAAGRRRTPSRSTSGGSTSPSRTSRGLASPSPRRRTRGWRRPATTCCFSSITPECRRSPGSSGSRRGTSPRSRRSTRARDLRPAEASSRSSGSTSRPARPSPSAARPRRPRPSSARRRSPRRRPHCRPARSTTSS